MKTSESYFVTSDKQRLYYKFYQSPKPRSVVVIIHGLNEHSGRYTDLVEYLTSQNDSVYVYDHRGHGKSDGHRSHIDHFDTFIKDLNELVRWIKIHEKNTPLFLIGHSMGGQILLNYLAKFKPSISGFVTSSANIEVAIKVSAIKKKAALFLAKYFPKLNLINEIDPLWICRDPEIVKAYKQDSLVSKKTSLGLLSQLILNHDEIYNLAPKIKLPAFLMHGGDDQICKAEGTRKFYEKLGSQDKSIKIYPHFYHEIFNEIGKEQVFDDMNSWMLKRLKH